MQTSFVCFACGNELLISDQESGEIICSYCGIVISERIEDVAHDVRTFSDSFSDHKKRTGPASSLSQYNKGFSTRMSRRNYKGSATPNDSTATLTDFGRIRLWDSRIRNSHEKGLEPALHELERLREGLGLPDAVVERSAYLIRKASELGLIKGRTIASMMAASVYLACRELETPKTLNEIASVSNVERKRLSRDYRLLLRTFNENLPIADLSKCITKIANIVGIGESRKRQAIELMNMLTAIGVSTGKSPLGLAATVIYVVCKNTNDERTQKVLAHAAGVTEVTIRNRCAELARLVASKKIPHFNSSTLTALALVSIQIAVITQHAWRYLPVLMH
jgi:transcription initiation factor TFIIB